MNVRTVLVTPLRPVLRSIQIRIENALRAAEERGERNLQAVASDLRSAHDREAAVQHGLRDELRRDHERRTDELDDQLRRISGQLVALEQRVADLERPPVELAADDADRSAARSLIDEVRLEHGRAQADLAAVAFYEERIARLERASGAG